MLALPRLRRHLPDRHPASAAFAATITLCVVQCWVWGLSSLDKLTNAGTFVSGFGDFVSARSTGSLPPIVGGFLQNIVLLAPQWWAVGAIATEVVLTLSFAGAALFLLLPSARWISRIVLLLAVASVGGFVFAVNLALINQVPAPWALGSPFASGVPVEYVLAGISAGTAVRACVLLRQLRGIRQRGQVTLAVTVAEAA